MSSRTSERLRALIIEDDPSIGRLIRRNLQKLGLEPTLRASGEAGLAFLDDNDVDLICLDLMLPNRSGFSICEGIRKMPRHARVPVLVISARGNPDARAHAEAVGCDGYLVKPFRGSDLAVEVQRLIARRFSDPSTETTQEWNTISGVIIRRDV